MRKSVRMVSIILAVLMLVCSFPLSVLAASPIESAYQGANKDISNKTLSVSKNDITAAGATVTLYAAFDNQTEGAKLNTSSSTGKLTYPLTSPDVGSIVHYDQRVCYSFAKVDGNMAIKMAGEAELSTGTSFFELPTTKGVDFVYQMDVKLSNDPTKNNILGANLIEFPNLIDGVVYVSTTGAMTSGSTAIGQLSAKEYVTVAVRVDVSEGIYYVYVNGVQKYTKADDRLKTGSITVRGYQTNAKTIGKAKLMDNDLYFDNVIMYTKSEGLQYVGEQQVKTPLFYSTFEYLPESSIGEPVKHSNAITAADRGEDGVNGYGSVTVPNFASSVKWVRESDGNVAIVSVKGDANNLINERKEQFLTFSGGKTGLNYYMSMDLKMGDTVAPAAIFGALARYNNNANTKPLVSVRANGSLYTNYNGNVEFGTLSSDKYSTVEVYIDIAADKYYVWFDGTLKTPNGLPFFSSTDTANLSDKYQYKLEAMRMYQIIDTTTMKDTDALYFDNISFYAEEPLKGEGFFEYGGYVYYRKNGETLKNGVYTLGDSQFKFDASGRLLKTVRTPVGAFKNNTTSELGVGSDTLKLVDEFKYDGSYPQTVQLTPNTALDKDGTSGVTLGDFDNYNNLSLEFNLYTDRIYENSAIGFIIFWDNRNSSGASVNSYHQTWINLGSSAVTGYQPAGGTNATNSYTYGNPRSVDGWTTLNIKMNTSRFDSIAATTAVKSMDFMLKTYAVGTWLYDESGTEQIINTDYTVYFSSVNYVTYGAPVTSLDGITGSGWLQFLGDGEYYYAPWDHQRVVGAKNAPAYAEVRIGGEKLVCAFDEKGAYTPANGKITVNGKTDYYKDGKSAVSTAGYTVSMNGFIDVNFCMILSEEIRSNEAAYLEFTRPDGTKLKTFLKDAPEDEYGYFRFTCGVAAAEMTDDITFIVSDGTKTIYEDGYSVVDYATAIINGSGSAFTDEAKAAARAMLNYGSYAQLYFDRKTENFANSGLGYDMSPDLNPIKDIVDISGIYDITDGAPSSGASYVSSTLSLLSATSIYHYFTLSGDVSDYTFTLGAGEGAVTLTPVKDGVTRYCVVIDGIAAKDLGTAYTVTVTNKNDASDSVTVTYSALGYADIVLDIYGNESDEKLSQLVALMKAMYKYYEAAAAYAESVR